jgi:hypothetical protein
MIGMSTVTTPHAVRVMRVWLSRADAGLVRGAVANAAVAVLDEQRRRDEWSADEAQAFSASPATGEPRRRPA